MNHVRASRSSRKHHSPRGESLESRCLLFFNFGGIDVPLDPPGDDPGVPPPPPTVEPPATEPAAGGGETAIPESPFLQVISTIPSHASTHSGPLQAIVVVFDRPLDPWSLGVADVLLERVGPDGSVEFTLESTTDLPTQQLDDSGTRLTVTLPAGLELTPGSYQIVISESAFLSGYDFSLMETVGLRHVVATFELAGVTGVTFADAIDLGAVGPVQRRIDGILDFHADPHAVDLYRFELSPGQRWRLGAEVQAQEFGSTLDAALTLFDSAGHVLATAELGLAGAPTDPFLFAALEPGVYFVGVSGAGNLPGTPGGYDPATGAVGTTVGGSASGEYRLRLVADRADEPTRVVNAVFTHADPFDPSPTGFTLSFTGAVVLPSAAGAPGIELVDEMGQVWPVAFIGSERISDELTFVFFQRMPLGQYRVRLTEPAGLTDLVGDAITATGPDAAALAILDVTAARGAHAPHDFGAIFPGALSSSIEDGATLQPGESITYRLVALAPFVSQMQLSHTAGAVTLTVKNTATGSQTTHHIGHEGAFALPLFFEAGEHLITFSNAGAVASNTLWTARGGSLLQERVDMTTSDGASALRLRLVGAQPSNGISGAWAQGSPSTTSPPSTGGTTPEVVAPVPIETGSGVGGAGPILGTTAPGASAATGGGTLPAATVASMISLSSFQGPGSVPQFSLGTLELGGPMGRTANVDAAAVNLASVVGAPGAPGFANTTVRMALAQGERANLRPHGDEGEIAPEVPDQGAIPDEASESEVAALAEAAPSAGESPVAAVESRDWVERIMRRLLDRGEGDEAAESSDQATAQLATSDPLARLVASADDEEESRESFGVDPMVLVVTAAVLIEGRRCLARWLGKRNGWRRSMRRRADRGLARA